MNQKNDFVKDNIERLKKIKNLKQHQKIILNLGEKKELTKDEKMMLKQAIKFEKSLQLMQKEKNKLNAKFKAEKEKEKKGRIEQLKPIITILEKSEIINKNTGELLVTEEKLLLALMQLKNEQKNKDDIRPLF